MLTILEQAAMTESMEEPSVLTGAIYHRGSDTQGPTILVTVLVSRSDDPDNQLHFDVPAFVIPGSGSPEETATWNVIWTLKLAPDSGLDSVSFRRSKGIDFSKSSAADCIPKTVKIPISVDPVNEEHPEQLQATITHNCDDVGSFTYTMYAEGSITEAGTKKPLYGHHDPTIVVVLDPMG